MNNKQKIARSALLITILGLMSKPLSFIREMLMASRFGGTVEMDAYLLSITAIALFTTLLNNAISTTLIPILAEIEDKEGKEGKLKHTNNILNILMIGALLLIVFAFVFSKYIMKVLAPGFTGNDFKLVLLLMRIGLPAILFNSIQGLFIGYLQSENRFLEPAAASIPLNLVFIIFLSFFSQFFGIAGLSVTGVLASIAQVFYMTFGAKKTNYKYEYHLDIHDEYVKKMFVLIPPILISVGINDINAIVDKSMGSTLINGSISAINFAEKLSTLVQGVFITAINTVMYPIIAREAVSEDYTDLKKSVVQTINLILLITIPATIAMMILSTPIVKVAFERGEFDSVATVMTSSALIFTAVRMISRSINLTLNNVYYSLKDTKTPLIISFVIVVINIILNFVFINSLKHKGLALATSISSIAGMFVSLYYLKNRLGPFGFKSSLIVFIKTLIASLIMGFIVYKLHAFLLLVFGASKLNDFIILVSVSFVGFIIYLILIYLFRINELRVFISKLINRY